jgi:hypothetical protein
MAIRGLDKSTRAGIAPYVCLDAYQQFLYDQLKDGRLHGRRKAKALQSRPESIHLRERQFREDRRSPVLCSD